MTLGPLLIDIEGKALTAEDRELFRHPQVGGMILFTRNFESVQQLTELVREVRSLRAPPLLITIDHEGGRVQRFREDFTVLPSMRLIGRRYDLDKAAGKLLARQCGWLMAAELLAVGIDLSFAPCVDLDYGISSVIGDRSFHRDPHAVVDLALAFIGGMKEAGMVATAKHFPGHGAVVADSHLALPIDRRAAADMTGDLYPYERLIANGLPAVMAAHVVYEDVDTHPASMSRRWLQDELRGRLGFSGAVFSDDLNMEGANYAGGPLERVRAAWTAGCDMLPLCNNRKGVLHVIDGFENSVDPVSQVRLARLHGRMGPTREELLSSTQWRECEQVVRDCLAPPALSLDP